MFIHSHNLAVVWGRARALLDAGCWMRASHQALYAIIELETQCYSLVLADSTLARANSVASLALAL